VHPFLQRVLDGQISLNIDPTSTIFSLPSHMQAATNLGELVLGLLGVAIVLVVGSMWRSRAMKEHGVPAEAATT
jgi:hypothetical protein